MSPDRGDFGRRFREARQARAMSLRDVSSATKISTIVLEALERNDVSRLPGGLFSRAFVRSYAREVGLDPDEMVREFEQSFRSGDSQPAEQRASIRLDSRAARARPGLGWLGLVITVLLIVAYFGLHNYLNRRTTIRTTRTGQVTGRPATPASVPASSTVAVPPPGATGTVPESQAAATGSAAPAVFATGTGEARQVEPPPPLHVVLTPAAACWVSARVDGRPILERILQPGERIDLAAAGDIELKVGDAAALAYTVNNAPGRPLGTSGQVVTVVINPANAQTFVSRQ